MAIAAVAGAIGPALFPAFLALRSMGTMVFEPEPFDYALVAASTFAVALGVQLVSWRTARSIAALAMLASGSMLFGTLTPLSLGIAVLPAGLVFLLLLYRALRRRPRSGTTTRAALGGASVGFAVPLLFIALVIPATVECRLSGGATSSRRWHPSQHVTMGTTSASGGVTTGSIDDGDSSVTYRCENGRVVAFERTAK